MEGRRIDDLMPKNVVKYFNNIVGESSSISDQMRIIKYMKDNHSNDELRFLKFNIESKLRMIASFFRMLVFVALALGVLSVINIWLNEYPTIINISLLVLALAGFFFLSILRKKLNKYRNICNIALDKI